MSDESPDTPGRPVAAPDEDARPRGRELGFRVWQQLPLLIALVALWMLLWGELSWLSLVTGILVAVAVPFVFYLPPVEISGRIHPWHLLVLLVVFLWQVTVASVVVAARAFGPKVTRNAVIAVPLRSRSDIILTLTAIMVSLVPGSLILEIDRYRATLYVHVLGTRDLDEVERFRRSVYDQERRIVRALGSRADLERIR